MNYDIVLITRNRRSALEISIPLMLTQSFPPSRLILVDSSDDHQSVARTVEAIFATSPAKVALEILATNPGTSLQRNFGLNHVRSEVVMFPDDDALWYPGYAEAIMSIYARDPGQSIGGVPGYEVKTPPPGTLTETSRPYAMTVRDRIMLLVPKPLRSLKFLPFTEDPVFLEGKEKSAGQKQPGWLAETNARVVGPMTGFTMSFRTSSISAQKFDETLGRYALFEDYDASLRVMDKQMIVKAGNAKVFHYKSPEKRTNGFEWGTIHILNRAFVVCKSSLVGSAARLNLLPYSRYKCMRYLAQCHTRYGRQRFNGALHALRYIRPLLDCPPEKLAGVFVAAREECLKHATKPAA